MVHPPTGGCNPLSTKPSPQTPPAFSPCRRVPYSASPSGGPARGKVTVTEKVFPSSAAPMVPPIRSVRPWAMASPRPVEVWVRAASAL